MQETSIQKQDILNTILGENTNKSENQENTVSIARVIGIRYKVYSFIIAIIIGYLIYISWPNKQNTSLYDNYLTSKNNLNNINLEIANFESKKINFNSDIALIDTISSQESQIISCFNQNI